MADRRSPLTAVHGMVPHLRAGMGFGAFFWGWFQDRFGRRHGFIWATAICGVAGLCTAFAPGLRRGIDSAALSRDSAMTAFGAPECLWLDGDIPLMTAP